MKAKLLAAPSFIQPSAVGGEASLSPTTSRASVDVQRRRGPKTISDDLCRERLNWFARSGGMIGSSRYALPGHVFIGERDGRLHVGGFRLI